MVAIALSSVAVARQSALTRKVQGTSSLKNRFVVSSRFHRRITVASRRVAPFGGWSGMEWISDAERPPGPVGSHLTNHESSNPYGFSLSKPFPRVRIADPFPMMRCDAMRSTSTARDDAAVSMRARVGANDFEASRSAVASVTRSTRVERTNDRSADRSIDRREDGRDTLARYGFDRDLSVSAFDEL